MKKLFALILTLVMVLSLAACGGGNSGGSGTSGGGSDTSGGTTGGDSGSSGAVSYTHLTLPTIGG